MKVKIKGFIRAYHWGDPLKKIAASECCFSENSENDEYSIVLGPCVVEADVDVPDVEQVTVALVAAYRAEQTAINLEAAKKNAVYEDKVQRLLAITNSVKS